MSGQQDNRSLGELFSALAADTGTLVRQEVELAKTEMTQKATRVGKDIGFLLAGARSLTRASSLSSLRSRSDSANSVCPGGLRPCSWALSSPLLAASWSCADECPAPGDSAAATDN